MKVIICGAGQVGFHIASYLAGEQNDLTVIDQSADLIGQVNETLDVAAFVGNASQPDVLENAGAADADMIIAVTFADEVNMVACQVAHSLFNVPTKIARIRQQSFLQPVWADLFSRDHMPIDVIISPEIEVAQAISRRLAVPGAFDMIPLAEDKVRVIGVRCSEDCPIVHTPLRQLTELFPDLHIVIVGIVHEDAAFIPKSTDQMFPGDEVYFVADTEHVPRALAAFGYEEQEAHRLVIFPIRKGFRYRHRIRQFVNPSFGGNETLAQFENTPPTHADPSRRKSQMPFSARILGLHIAVNDPEDPNSLTRGRIQQPDHSHRRSPCGITRVWHDNNPVVRVIDKATQNRANAFHIVALRISNTLHLRRQLGGNYTRQPRGVKQEHGRIRKRREDVASVGRHPTRSPAILTNVYQLHRQVSLNQSFHHHPFE